MKSAFYGYFRQSQFLFRHPADRIGYFFPDHVLFRRIAGNVSEMSHETAPRHGGNFQQIFQVKILQIMLVQVLQCFPSAAGSAGYSIRRNRNGSDDRADS